MDATINQAMKIAFFLLSGALLTSFGIVTLIEGIIAQAAKYQLAGIVFYFVSMCAFGATFWTYTKAKKILSTL